LDFEFCLIFFVFHFVKLKLQGAVDGYATDDLIVFVENPANNNERCRLLGQVKNSITITIKSKLFFCKVIIKQVKMLKELI
jgi:hypothetical protein